MVRYIFEISSTAIVSTSPVCGLMFYGRWEGTSDLQSSC